MDLCFHCGFNLVDSLVACARAKHGLWTDLHSGRARREVHSLGLRSGSDGGSLYWREPSHGRLTRIIAVGILGLVRKQHRVLASRGVPLGYRGACNNRTWQAGSWTILNGAHVSEFYGFGAEVTAQCGCYSWICLIIPTRRRRLIPLDSDEPAPTGPSRSDRPLHLPRRADRIVELEDHVRLVSRRRHVPRVENQVRHFSPGTDPVDLISVCAGRQRLLPRRAPRQVEVLQAIHVLAQLPQDEDRLGVVIVKAVAVEVRPAYGDGLPLCCHHFRERRVWSQGGHWPESKAEVRQSRQVSREA